MPRSGIYYYWRRVPKVVSHLDDRAPLIHKSLKTDDLAQARKMRDLLEEADDQLWGGLLSEGGASTQALAAHRSAQLRAEALGFAYKPASEVAQLPIQDIVRRFAAISDLRTPVAVEAAILGGVAQPEVTVTRAFEIYCDEIVASENAGKSTQQKEHWKAGKARTIDSFVEICGDLAMTDLTRDHGRQFYQHWLKLIVTEKGEHRRSPSLGNRSMSNMRVLHERYFTHIGQPDRENPFAKLSFEEKKKPRGSTNGAIIHDRFPFPSNWIADVILKPGALAGMNAEARAIVLTMIETGARNAEICNLSSGFIKLDCDVPHILIEPRYDVADPREIKTASSVRLIPLVGVALEAMKRFPDGFKRYYENANTFSATANKFFRENKLRPSQNHKMYSFRHSFEDRMKEANIDWELRNMLFGHAIDRPDYGSGGSLKWRQSELMKIALPFDPSIV